MTEDEKYKRFEETLLSSGIGKRYSKKDFNFKNYHFGDIGESIKKSIFPDNGGTPTFRDDIEEGRSYTFIGGRELAMLTMKSYIARKVDCLVVDLVKMQHHLSTTDNSIRDIWLNVKVLCITGFNSCDKESPLTNSQRALIQWVIQTRIDAELPTMIQAYYSLTSKNTWWDNSFRNQLAEVNLEVEV